MLVVGYVSRIMFLKIIGNVTSMYIKTGHQFPPSGMKSSAVTCRRLYVCFLGFGDRGSTVVKVLCYKSEGR